MLLDDVLDGLKAPDEEFIRAEDKVFHSWLFL